MKRHKLPEPLRITRPHEPATAAAGAVTYKDVRRGLLGGA